ncbi:unnamed protein product [Bursaphelenchus xylophilus]|uniref:(pine wood nematode) hypothetical protein n=1 Tax=Bursaphelenchus xylophilus TaxID=6326 RepID=A0A1I7RSD8_BURXY|nr:unnamed protein product [Bursaphelenchus xylophilus]CAG9123023.1 unnamed protein product [Bursaphelenchus xylophilus]
MSRYVIRAADRFKNALVEHNLPGLRFLIEGFNYYDVSRVKDVGPDRAAAEWIVRCGGAVKFDKFNETFDDYNSLIRVLAELDPAKPSDQVILSLIDATNSSVSGYGCRHFAGLKGVQSVKYVGCKSLNDMALEIMGKEVGGYLPFLQLERCPRITEYGIKHLEQYRGLKKLIIKDLKNVHKPDRSLDSLKNSLPNCDITFSC